MKVALNLLVILLSVYLCPTRVFLMPAPSTIADPSTSHQAPVIGFDCNQTEPEILTLSTLDVGSCPEISSLKPTVRTEYGQLLQTHTLDMIHVRTCQITKSTFYFRCARNWYNYNVYPPSVGVVLNVRPDACEKIHKTGTYTYSTYKPVWTDLTPNMTYYHDVNEIGWTDKYGYCEGGTAYIESQEHKDIVVQASYTISIRESWSKVDLDTGKVNIENTLQCSYHQGSCQDAKTGTHTWTPRQPKCSKGEYRTLYEGPVNITSSPGQATIVSVNSPPFLFTSEMGFNTYTCGLSLTLTEFPSVFFAPQKNGVYQSSFPPTDTNDIEFITYLNSKITFMYHNLIDSARDMYLTAIQKTCEVERQMLRNRIEIIRLNSQSGGLSSLLKEGMFARANGEVIHLIKCEPVPVQLRQTETCHEALPVLSGDQSVFLLPNTHILTPYSPEIPCSSITPITYKIGGKWWSYSGSFQMASDPTILQPHMSPDIPFTKIRSFSKGGMYASEQIEAVQKMLVFPNLRESIATNIATGITKYYGKSVTMDITSIMSDYDYENIAYKNLKKVWGYFASVGNAVSGLIGIYFIFRIIKGALNCLIDGKSLYQTFGCSFRILAMFWSRLSLYFLHQANQANVTTSTHASDMEPPEAVVTGTDEEDTGISLPTQEPSAPVRYQPYKPVYPDSY